MPPVGPPNEVCCIDEDRQAHADPPLRIRPEYVTPCSTIFSSLTNARIYLYPCVLCRGSGSLCEAREALLCASLLRETSGNPEQVVGSLSRVIYTRSIDFREVEEVLGLQTAKLFMNGRSQAVRLPKGFRLDGEEVFVKRVGNAVVLLPKSDSWQTLYDSLPEFSQDFMVSRDQPELSQQRQAAFG